MYVMCDVIIMWMCVQFLVSGREYVTRKHNEDKVMVFERGGLVWILNFHPTNSYVDYRVAVETPGRCSIIHCTCKYHCGTSK